MCTVAAGSWGGRRLSLADYVIGTARRMPPESANVGYPPAKDGQASPAPRGYGYRWYRVGDYLLKCSETETLARD